MKKSEVRGIAMKENIAATLTGKDDKYACALADKIISESLETDEWYEYFDDFASLSKIISEKSSIVYPCGKCSMG